MIHLLDTFFNTIKQIFSTQQTSIENQTTKEVVKDKKSLKKASDITEKILTLVDKYMHLFEKQDQIQYNKLKEKFFKVN